MKYIKTFKALTEAYIDKDGNLTLFSLLETICDGINQSTGGATMLEPAIKNDNVVYILEQNFI